MLVALPAWSLGTASGVAAGSMLSFRVVSALSVALYGIFLAIIIGILLAWFGASLFQVSVASCIAVFIIEMFI